MNPIRAIVSSYLHSRQNRIGLGLLAMLAASAPGVSTFAAPLDACAPAVAEVVSLQGAIEVQRRSLGAWQPAAIGDLICLGDSVRTGPLSRAALALVDESVLRLDQRTTLRLRAEQEREPSLIELLLGALHFFSQRPRTLGIGTPFVNAGAEGTEFVVRVSEDRAAIIMLEGIVRASNPQGELRVVAGQAAVAEPGEAPRREIVVRVRDAVAWAIYYPPIQAALAGGAARRRDLPRELALASQRVAANDYQGALRILEDVPDPGRDARYHVFRAGVLLNVGRVREAREAIERAVAMAPGSGDALAQLAIIELAQDERPAALENARRAVELSPESPPAWISLSYALQAQFELERAREALQQAVGRAPEDALAWARLAEIELSLGRLDAAREAAERAVALAPALARTQKVLGFAELVRFDTAAARAAFERAIAPESANPLPRLGLGLAMIREGELAEGRRQIEIAANLDPTDALIRSYLGKAYFEEHRDADADEQLQIAKELDPNDPTPWFYDAIRKQLDNRPVEALRDLERAIALNDNRAVYRSRLLLDQDLATRSVSLARIYDDLGFDQVALAEASKSLSLDPANWSAHRFLSDSYAQLPRHEIARASELLQAQLLQPININPVQPSLSVTDINIVEGTGPAQAAFNEFHPLFLRDQAQLTASGLVGTQDTLGDEVVASGLWDRYSFSAGQFHLQNDGFRPNNDFQADIYDLFGQVAVTPKLSLQTEYRHRDTEQGDLELVFDPDEFFPTDRLDIQSDIIRAGGHFAPTPGLDFLLHAGYVEREESLSVDDAPFFLGDQVEDSSGYQVEAQMIRERERFSLVVGAGFYDVDVDLHSTGDFVVVEGFAEALQFPREQVSFYLYDTVELLEDLQVILGASYDEFEQGRFETDGINPKLGVIWQATDRLRLRGAYFETLKRALAVDQTIETTQVADFNQFFDDDNGTQIESVGFGLDYRLRRDWYVGFEFLQRELERPRINSVTTVATSFEDVDERRYRGYVYWTPARRWALSTEILLETFERDAEGLGFAPDDLDTLSVPLDVRYFDPSGFFAQLVTRFIYQDVDRVDDPFTPEGTVGDETFVVVDAAVGYRLPQRRGIVSLEGRNLLDENFRFQDDNFRTSEIRASPLRPERSVLARVTLNF